MKPIHCLVAASPRPRNTFVGELGPAFGKHQGLFGKLAPDRSQVNAGLGVRGAGYRYVGKCLFLIGGGKPSGARVSIRDPVSLDGPQTVQIRSKSGGVRVGGGGIGLGQMLGEIG